MLKKITIIITILSLGLSSNLSEVEREMLSNEAMQKMMAEIFKEAMKVKKDFQSNQIRQELIENLSSTAPREEFIINADLSTELSESNPSATIYVSTDNQETWINSENIGPLNENGFETTWGTTVNTVDSDVVNWYLSGLINSTALGFDYGEIIVSQSPQNVNNQWPPNNNLYATLVNDDTGDTDSEQDIISLSGTYRSSGEDIEELYVKLSLNSSCCNEGSIFGPWYLYGVGIVNPESEDAVAYAIGYADGGFLAGSQLYPGLLKLTGDFASGEIAGFEYITPDINYSTAGNDLQVSVLLDYITNDSQFGLWPNSLQGLIVLGVTVSADLSFSTNIHDQTNPGLFLLSSQYQNGNVEPNITDGAYDDETMTLSVNYQDDDGNLPWFKSGQICYSGTDNCFINLNLTPNSHTYLEGVTYSGSIIDEEISSGDYDIKFWFEDDDEIGVPQIVIPVTIGSSCGTLGDINGDNNINVVDVVTIVNYVLNNDTSDSCADLSNDGLINVVDIVQLVNLILGD
ncbi:MAG: hypothetical protein CMF96_09750 [Candidatus Marinimicrobia bacterium]|nr:hypothetical protein [Candidatus Neomarinimicrobiota bacterium]|tara:strand:+ start:976 stop:2526 length:1551 start_codon:yes stop_codon:yes gene_type:complete